MKDFWWVKDNTKIDVIWLWIEQKLKEEYSKGYITGYERRMLKPYQTT